MRRYLLAFTIPLVLGILSVFLALVMIYFHPSLTVALLAFLIGGRSGAAIREQLMESGTEKPASLGRRIVGQMVVWSLTLGLLALVLAGYMSGVIFQISDLLTLLFAPGVLLGYLFNWCFKHPLNLGWIPMVGIVLWSRLSRLLQGSAPIQKKNGTHATRNLPRPHRR